MKTLTYSIILSALTVGITSNTVLAQTNKKNQINFTIGSPSGYRMSVPANYKIVKVENGKITIRILLSLNMNEIPGSIPDGEKTKNSTYKVKFSKYINEAGKSEISTLGKGLKSKIISNKINNTTILPPTDGIFNAISSDLMQSVGKNGEKFRKLAIFNSLSTPMNIYAVESSKIYGDVLQNSRTATDLSYFGVNQLTPESIQENSNIDDIIGFKILKDPINSNNKTLKTSEYDIISKENFATVIRENGRWYFEKYSATIPDEIKLHPNFDTSITEIPFYKVRVEWAFEATIPVSKKELKLPINISGKVTDAELDSAPPVAEQPTTPNPSFISLLFPGAEAVVGATPRNVPGLDAITGFSVQDNAVPTLVGLNLFPVNSEGELRHINIKYFSMASPGIIAGKTLGTQGGTVFGPSIRINRSAVGFLGTTYSNSNGNIRRGPIFGIAVRFFDLLNGVAPAPKERMFDVTTSTMPLTTPTVSEQNATIYWQGENLKRPTSTPAGQKIEKFRILYVNEERKEIYLKALNPEGNYITWFSGNLAVQQGSLSIELVEKVDELGQITPVKPEGLFYKLLPKTVYRIKVNKK